MLTVLLQFCTPAPLGGKSMSVVRFRDIEKAINILLQAHPEEIMDAGKEKQLEILAGKLAGINLMMTLESIPSCELSSLIGDDEITEQVHQKMAEHSLVKAGLLMRQDNQALPLEEA